MPSLALELSAPALFLAGAAAGLHCALMCGAWQALHLADRGTLSLPRALTLLHGVRVTGYALLGAIAGGAGGVLLRALPGTGVGRLLQVLAGASLVAAGILQLHGRASAAKACCVPAPRALSGVPPPARLIARGLLWALLPCGILYAMLPLAVFSGSAATGAALLAAFGLGTTPLLAGSAGVLALTRAGRVAGIVLIGAGVASAAAVLLESAALLSWCRAPF